MTDLNIETMTAADLRKEQKAILGNMKKRRHAEGGLQRSVIHYLTLLENQGKLTFFAVPNGEKRDAKTAAILKGQGVRAGVADIVVLRPRMLHMWDRPGGPPGNGWREARPVFLELKAPEGALSTAQKTWRTKVEGMGFSYFVIRSLNDLQEVFA